MSLSFLLPVTIALFLLIFLAWRTSRNNPRSGDSGYSGSWGSDTSSCDNSGCSCDGGGGGGDGDGDGGGGD